jgi:hypothetical protein
MVASERSSKPGIVGRPPSPRQASSIAGASSRTLEKPLGDIALDTTPTLVAPCVNRGAFADQRVDRDRGEYLRLDRHH